jgi:hypothetical protein
MEKEDIFDVAIVGAGPSGIIAAGVVAESGAKVILIEKNERLGQKLLLTGNGRCNITNAEFNLRKLVNNYGKEGEFLFHAFSVFGPKEVINFFNSLGIETKIENNKRVFPKSGKSKDILNVLEKYLLERKVNILLNSQVSRIISKNNKIEKLVVGDREIIAKNYIICTGGKSYPITGSTGDGFRWLEGLGHTISEPSPALVPIKTREDWVMDLQGLALKDVEISVKKQFKEIGDVLFTHFGLSGPLILDISKRIGKLLKQGEVKLNLDLLPNLNIEVLDKEFRKKVKETPKRSIKSLLADFMPKRLVMVFMKKLKIEDKQINNITKEERRDIIKLLKNIEVTVIDLLGFDLAMVTSGGVSLKEIDDKTMKSKIIDNLYFAGEIINIDGRSGGFNLQLCWSTGYLAGKSIYG